MMTESEKLYERRLSVMRALVEEALRELEGDKLERARNYLNSAIQHDDQWREVHYRDRIPRIPEDTDESYARAQRLYSGFRPRKKDKDG